VKLSLAGLGKLVGGERVADLTLATKGIVGNLQIANGSLWAWYQVGPVAWAFTSDPARHAVWDALVGRFAGLGGRAIKLRTTTKPYPAYEFARTLDADTPHPLPDVAGAFSFGDYLTEQQKRLQSSLLDEKVVYLGVQVGPAPKPAVWKQLTEPPRGPLPVGPVKALTDEVRKLDQHVRGGGLNAAPATARQMAWLMHRSVGMGMPVSMHAGVAGDVWTPTDLYAFTESVTWTSSPLGATVRVAGVVAGQEIVRYAAVLSLGRMPDRRFPEDGRDPWMLAADKLPFPVEWVASGALVKGKDLASTAKFELDRAINIEKHYRDEHDMEPPPAVARGKAHAVRTYDEVTEGEPKDAVRFSGPVRVAVYADTPDQALINARDLIDTYGESHQIELAHPKGQREMLREFIPGEGWSTTGYQRRMPVKYFAAAMPHISSSVGTDSGPYLGYTVSTARRAFRIDPHFPMEQLNNPGLVPIVAEPGGGKSHAVGMLSYHGVKQGQPTAILDPSGPLGRLCALPELAPHSRLFNLTRSPAGTLSPPQLIPVPKPHEFHGETAEDDWLAAVKRAAGERRQLLLDTLRMLLPADLLANHGTDRVLRDAVRVLGGGADANPSDIMRILKDQGTELALEIRGLLFDAAEYPLGELIFPTSGEISVDRADDKALVVITMPGLVPPDTGSDPREWSTEQRYTLPLLHLAAFYTSRFIYGQNMHQRKNIFLDENHFMGSWGSGKALFIRLSRDSRKWNTAVWAASQHPDDVLVGKVESLIGGALVGRLEDAETARIATTQLLRAPEEYAQVVTGLSPRPAPGQSIDSGKVGEFLYRDAYGRVAKVRFDAAWHPELLAALNTTPGLPHVTSPTPGPVLEEAR
jgi:hypothetical protein